MPHDARVSVVVLTYNRRAELARCLHQLSALPEAPPVVVVDNGSADGTPEFVEAAFPLVNVVRAGRNLGAAGRNLGVACVTTPYVAFCDDDTWWHPGALARATDLLDAHPHVAVLAARVLIGADERLDPTCAEMAASPLGEPELPGPLLIGFMAGAAVVRVDAFRQAGGYAPQLFLGAEEALLSLDLAALGWKIVYTSEIVTHHHPSSARNRDHRHLLLLRNRVCVALLRLPVCDAWRVIRDVWREVIARQLGVRLLWALLPHAPWIVRARRPVPADVATKHARVHNRHRRRSAPAATLGASSRAREPGAR